MPAMKRSAQPAAPCSIDQTLAIIREHCRPLHAAQLPLAKALAHVLRQTVAAPEDQPPFDRSAVDGYAVRLDDPATRFKVVDFIRAGQWKTLRLKPGCALQIATGAALPGPGLQVIMKEDVVREGDNIHLRERDAERHIRFRGEDAKAGTELVPPGTRLNAGTLALLASVGCVKPLVTRPLRVLHLTTGNEIIPAHRAPRPGQIRDANSVLVRAFLAAWPVKLRHAHLPENRAVQARQLASLCADDALPDLLLISGGASVGEHDFTRELIAGLGYRIQLSKTSARPGKPLIFGTAKHGPAFGLPGNPLAHFVCLNLYVRAAVEQLVGLAAPLSFAEGKLATNLAAGANERETLWPAIAAVQGGRVWLTPLPWRSSGDLTPLARANALLRVPPATKKIARGAAVSFQPTQYCA